jgi:hypothetical protein
MKLLAISLGIVSSVAAVFFALAFALHLESSQAVTAGITFAGLVLSTFPKVAEFLEQQASRKRLAAGRRKPVYDFRGFQIAWPLMVVYGTVALSLVGQTAAGIAGLILASVMSFEGENAPKAAMATGVFGIIATIFGAYLVGRWIGARTSRLGIVAMLLIAPLTAVAGVELDVLLMPDEVYRGTFGSEGLAFFGILMRITKTAFIIVVPGLIGYWRGQRRRLSKYLDYLLSVLPQQTRDTVVDLAFEEAQKVAATVGEVRPSDRA